MGAFDISAETAAGEFRRQGAQFRASHLEPVAGRYHLYVSLACPWCHRVAIVRELMGLTEAIPMYFAAPFRDERGWAFTGEAFDDGPGGRYVDPLNGWSFAREGYLATDPSYADRVTLPLLWDAERGAIVCNESADLIRLMNDARSLGALGPGGPDLRPSELREEIDAINERVYETVNNGVYRAGFARTQAAYEEAFAELFDSLEWLEGLLAQRRYVAGETLTEADWRLWVTLVRFDEVYHVHFRCNRRRIVEYPNLWAYARELYQHPGVERTVAMEQIKRHYYTTHDELNPKRIIPVGPAPDWWAPHRR